LEVIVSLAILAIGAALTLSLISGSLGNIRKVQMRARIVQHAESVMELALLDESIRQPTTYTGDFEDGTRWIVHVDEYEMPDLQLQTNVTGQTKLPRLYAFSVDVTGPDSSKPDFHLQTLKMINTDQKAMSPELPK
jgi:type II secretory pathway pseudopilin PulG